MERLAGWKCDPVRLAAIAKAGRGDGGGSKTDAGDLFRWRAVDAILEFTVLGVHISCGRPGVNPV